MHSLKSHPASRWLYSNTRNYYRFTHKFSGRAVFVIPVLGYGRRQRADKQWNQPGFAHPVAAGSDCGQPQQVEHCPVAGARHRACGNTPHSPAIRFVVHARQIGDAFAAQRNPCDGASATRHGLVSAARTSSSQRGGPDQKTAWTTSNIGNQTHPIGGRGIAIHAAETDALWQGAVGSPTFGCCIGTLSERHKSTCSLVRILRCRQAPLVEGALVAGDRIGTDRRGDPANLHQALEYRAILPQPETLVGSEQPVAAIQTRAGIVDADPFNRMDTDTITQSDGRTGILPAGRRRTLAHQASVHRWIGGAMDAYRVYRTCLQGWFQPEVTEIRLPDRAQRPKNAHVAAPASAADVFPHNLITLIAHWA